MLMLGLLAVSFVFGHPSLLITICFEVTNQKLRQVTNQGIRQFVFKLLIKEKYSLCSGANSGANKAALNCRDHGKDHCRFGCMLASSWSASICPCIKPALITPVSQARWPIVKRPRHTLVVSGQQTSGTMLLEEKKKLVADSIRGVPDFPKKGILFWDITTLCLDPAAFRCCIEAFTERYKDKKIDVIAGQDRSSLTSHC